VNKAGAVTVGEICWRRNVNSPSNWTPEGGANLPPNYLKAPTRRVRLSFVLRPNESVEPIADPSSKHVANSLHHKSAN